MGNLETIHRESGSYTDKLLSVVVPCYRDEGNILELFSRLKATLDRVAPNHEIIYVNDASPDNSREILDDLAAKHPELTVIHHSRNFGLMGVYATGMKQALGDAVILMDGDLQDPPELIEQFVEKWNEGYLVVYGQTSEREETLARRVGIYLFYRVWSRLSKFHIPEDAGDFSLIDRRVVDIINDLPEKDRFIRGLRAWAGFPQIGVKFKRGARFSGTSTQSFANYFSWAGFAITSFSYVPLRMVSIVALIATAVSVLFFAFLLVLFFFDIRGPRGYMMMVSLILFLSSGLFICLGIISEYLIRIYIETKNRPDSIIGEMLNDHRKESGDNSQKPIRTHSGRA